MTSSAMPSASSDPRRTPTSSGVWFTAAIGATMLALWASWSRFPAVWTNDRSHGWVIAALCLWLVWRDRSALQRQSAPQQWAALPLLGLSLLWMMAVIISAQVVHLALVPVLLLGWLYVVRGEGAAREGAQIGAAFSLAIPVWEALIGPLQSMTVLVNTALLFITRIPAKVEGSLIHLEAGSLHVANSCAGLNYLMSGLTLGVSYAFLFTTGWRTRLKITLAAGAVAILSNWLRVFGLVLVGHFTAMKSSLMADHVVYGWLIFAGSMPLFFTWAARIEKAAAAKGTVTVREASPTFHPTAPASMALATAATIAGPLLLLLLSSTQRPPIVAATVPGIALAPAEQSAAANAARAWTVGFSGAQQSRTFAQDVLGIPVQVDYLVYGAQDQAGEMVGVDNQVAADSLVAGQGMIGPLDDSMRMVREVLVKDGNGGGRVVWYWYRVSGVETPSTMKAKLLEFWSFVKRQPASEIVVVSAPCAARDCKQARAALFFAVTGREMPAPSTP